MPQLTNSSGDEEENASADGTEELENSNKDMDTPDDTADGEADGPDREEDEPTGEEAFEASQKSLKGRTKKKACQPCKGAKDMGMEDDGSLKDHEKGYMGEASGFLKELAQPESELNEEGRFKSYHYHKTMDGIANYKAAGDPNRQAPTTLPENDDSDPMSDDAIENDFKGMKKRRKSDPARQAPTTLPENDDSDPMNDDPLKDEMSKDMHPHRAAAGKASGFFKSLSGERAFGDPHRKACESMAKSLDDVTASGNDNGGETDDGSGPPGVEMEDPAHEPGEMGEKRLKIIQAALAQQKAISAATKKLERLVAALNGKH